MKTQKTFLYSMFGICIMSLFLISGCTNPSNEMTDQQTIQQETIIGYMEYHSDTLENALTENKQVVLFFHANRCPSCRQLDKTLEKEIDMIPEDIVILNINYDKSDELKKTYNVTTQHTLVAINSDRSERNKIIGGENIDDIINLVK